MSQEKHSARPRARRRWRSPPLAPMTAALTAAALLRLSPSVRLRRAEVSFPYGAEELISRLEAKLIDDGEIESSSHGEYVARFAGRAGPFSYRTRERVRFRDRTISFEHLEGPFRSCTEYFVVHGENGTSLVAHDGAFTMGGGLPGWLFGAAVVRPIFERVVVRELARMAAPIPGPGSGMHRRPL